MWVNELKEAGRDKTGRFKKGFTPWNKGLKGYHSGDENPMKRPEVRKKMSEIRTGIKLSEETKQKIRERNLGKKLTGEQKKKIGDGIRNSDKYYLSLKTRRHPLNSGQFKKGLVPWNKGKTISEDAREKIIKARMKQIMPLKDTKPERMLQSALSKEHIEFVTHYSIYGQPDIVTKPKIAIFCDGDYWHNLPTAMERDKKVNKILRQSGWTVLRFWEHEIYEGIESVVESIKEVMI